MSVLSGTGIFLYSTSLMLIPTNVFYPKILSFPLLRVTKTTLKLTALLLLGVSFLLLTSCQKPKPKEDQSSGSTPNTLFTLLSPAQTHVDFSNTLTEGVNTNVLMYEYFYNGGGVAIGDVNNDGLEDMYFTGNMTANRLYLNRTQPGSPIQFEDITPAAGVASREGPWKTGVTMADVNGDGFLDIYVCFSGNLRPERRLNELYINQGPNDKGIPHFTEQAKQYGLDSPAASTQATFFDYDKDGDLDMFLLNHNIKSLPILDEASTADLLRKPDLLTGVRLYRNEPTTGSDGKTAPYFTDVTEKSGISSSALTYGLGAGVADINGDGWTDIYISNDYAVPDYLYINNHNGTFTDQKTSAMGHTSQFSMGNEVADVNNDGLLDIFTLDMLPEDNKRQKLLFAPDNYEKFNQNIQTGFYYQYMRNMLQVNNGDGTFSEAGQLAGLSNTDWSWAPLLADYDNDGWKDLYVTNGYVRDFTHMDFMKYAENYKQQKGRLMREDVLNLVQQMPSSQVSNYFFQNNGFRGKDKLSFANVGTQWGTNQASNSNGAAYADLDNDGDLDLVVNNINQPAFIYQNEADKQFKRRYLSVKLQGAGMNTQGMGATITIYAKGQQQYLEQMPTRGFQSSVSPVLHFGLGDTHTIDSLRVVWPSGKQQLIQSVPTNQVLALQEKNALTNYKIPQAIAKLFEEVKTTVTFLHHDAAVNDFKRQPLLVSPLSFAGPCLVKGDANGDGLEDIYAGGGSGQAGVLYLRQKGGSFLSKPIPAFEADKGSDDVDAAFLDANGDGAMDLYVCSGGYDNFTPDDALLQDRLYLNTGKDGNGFPAYTKSTDALPAMRSSKSCVSVADVNGDNHPDLFVGGRVIPGRYPETPHSYLLINDGKGHFKDNTAALSPTLSKIGMVTDAAWLDLNGDQKQDLVLVGEWMPLTVLLHTNGKWVDHTKDYFGKEYRGFWNKLLVDDFNKDGKPDLIVGNLGLNTQCRASEQEPADMIYKDFDDNGSVDPILCFYIQGNSYPYVTRDELLDQMSMMRTRFPDYKSYAETTLTTIFTPEELAGATRLQANYLKTAYFESDAKGKFQEKNLPQAVQLSPVCALTSLDYDQDGNQDILLGGNINQARLRFGKSDASFGTLLKGDGKGHFTYIPQRQSGFHVSGDVRSIISLGNTVLFGINQQALQAYQTTKR
jgi:hypothetical protein